MQDSAIVINEEKVSLPNNVKKIPATNNIKKVPVTNNVKKVSVTENKKIVPLTDNEKKVPFTEKKNISIVYVHGFRGGKNTFWDFPELLKKSMKTYNVEVNNKVYFTFL